MTRSLLGWKRYWSLRTARLLLDAQGFLYDPEPHEGISFNRDAVTFSQIEETPCLVLLGEPGIGKTETIKQEFAGIKSAAEASNEYPLHVDLRATASDVMLFRKVFEAPDIRKWASGGARLHLFLDSLDECRLSVENVADVLLDGLTELPHDRLFLRIACRTGEWPRRLEDGLKGYWGEDRTGVYELAPLTRADVAVAAESRGVDAGAFLEAVGMREAGAFASRPTTLFFLLGAFRQSGQLPTTKAELYLQGCRQLCEERSDSRRARGRTGSLDPDQRLALAGRIAAVMTFCGCPAVWKGVESPDAPAEDAKIADLVGGKEAGQGSTFDVSDANVREVLEQTGLFTSRGLDRHGFAHQTYAEFLAAWYFKQRRASLEQIESLIFHAGREGGKVIPQLHETAAWLAGMEPAIFEKIMRNDPVVLLKSDIAAAEDDDKATLLVELLGLFERGMIFDRDLVLYRHYHKLEHPRMAEQLRPYLRDPSKPVAARCVAIDVAERCHTTMLQGDLAEVALDGSQPEPVRIDAACAVQSIADRETRARLKPLLSTSPAEDPDDRIRGYALKALWPEIISATELFDAITPPRNANLHASYTSFLGEDVLPHLKTPDLATALLWTEKQPSRHGASMDIVRLVDGVLAAAMDHLDDDGVVDALAGAIIARWQRHDHAVVPRYDSVALERMSVDVDHRRRLVETIVIKLPEDVKRHLIWQLSQERLLLQDDFTWVLGKAGTDTDPSGRRKWARLASTILDPDNVAHTNALIGAASECQELQEEFAWALQPVDLNSAAAREARERQRETEELRPRPRERRGPPPREQVAALLDRLDEGDLDAWWKLDRMLEFNEDGSHGGHGTEPDLTDTAGWKGASGETKACIERSALLYLEKGDPHADDWLGSGKSDWRAVAGYRALRLVLSRGLMDVAGVLPAMWQKWMPAILDYLNVGSEDIHKEIVKEAYAKAPSVAINVLRKLVASELGGTHSVNVLRQMDLCWDEMLSAAVLEMTREEDIAPEALAELLRPLLERRFDDAVAFALSKVQPPFPSEGTDRDTALAVATVFLQVHPGAAWDKLWEGIAADPDFGERLFLKAACVFAPRQLPQVLCAAISPDAIVELYIWLERHFPHEEDPDHKGSGVHAVGPRDFVADLRDGCLEYLRQAGEYEAVRRIQQALPGLEWMKWVALDAHENMLRGSWAPVAPDELMRMLARPENRLVENGQQLLQTVLAALDRLQERLHGHTPEARFLWDEMPGRKGLWRPKDENSFSDYVKIHLDRELRERGIIVNREVEVRRPGKGIGERTDVHVDAVARRPRDGRLDRITVVVEVKGCWNLERDTAMEGQLAGKYLVEGSSRHGVYLIGWFNCDKWDPEDSRRRPKMTIEQARDEYAGQAKYLTGSTSNTIRAVVLDCNLP